MTNQEKIKSLKAKIDLKRTLSEKVTDFLTVSFGTVWFLNLNAVWFLVWLLINTGFTDIKPFDPFPFGMLTTIVSLEAIFLAIIVLISQNRAAKVAELREELDLQVNVKAEAEVTKVLVLLDHLHKHLGINQSDENDLIEMKQETNLEEIERELEKDMEGK